MKEVINLEGVVCYINIPHREGGDQSQTQSSTNPSLRVCLVEEKEEGEKEGREK